MKYCPFCGVELLPGALSFRHRLSLWCAGEERTSPRLRRGSAQLALPILCSRWLYEKGRLPVWGSFLFFFSSGPGLSGPAPRCGNSFSSGEAGEPLGGLAPSSADTATTRASRRAAGKRGDTLRRLTTT